MNRASNSQDRGIYIEEAGRILVLINGPWCGKKATRMWKRRYNLQTSQKSNTIEFIYIFFSLMKSYFIFHHFCSLWIHSFVFHEKKETLRVLWFSYFNIIRCFCYPSISWHRIVQDFAFIAAFSFHSLVVIFNFIKYMMDR